MDKLKMALVMVFATLAVASAVVATYFTIKYWNTPAGEIPWWVWWLVHNK